MLRVIRYDTLATADLFVDAVYEGEAGSQLSGEPLSKLILGIANLGGFRPSGIGKVKKFIVLCTGGKNEGWPNRLDALTGKFTYYGDNKDPVKDLHDTPLGGNQILRDSFEALHVEDDQRIRICPFFVFQTHPTPVSSRSYQFKGLAVPGYAAMPETADLIAFWTTSKRKKISELSGHVYNSRRSTDQPCVDKRSASWECPLFACACCLAGVG